MTHLASEFLTARVKDAGEIAAELARNLREPHKSRVLGGAVEAAAQVVTGVNAVTALVRHLGEAES